MMFQFTGIFSGHTGMLELWDPDEYKVWFMASSMEKRFISSASQFRAKWPPKKVSISTFSTLILPISRPNVFGSKKWENQSIFWAELPLEELHQNWKIENSCCDGVFDNDVNLRGGTSSMLSFKMVREKILKI